MVWCTDIPASVCFHFWELSWDAVMPNEKLTRFSSSWLRDRSYVSENKRESRTTSYLSVTMWTVWIWNKENNSNNIDTCMIELQRKSWGLTNDWCWNESFTCNCLDILEVKKQQNFLGRSQSGRICWWFFGDGARKLGGSRISLYNWSLIVKPDWNCKSLCENQFGVKLVWTNEQTP